MIPGPLSSTSLFTKTQTNGVPVFMCVWGGPRGGGGTVVSVCASDLAAPGSISVVPWLTRFIDGLLLRAVDSRCLITSIKPI